MLGVVIQTMRHNLSKSIVYVLLSLPCIYYSSQYLYLAPNIASTQVTSTTQQYECPFISAALQDYVPFLSHLLDVTTGANADRSISDQGRLQYQGWAASTDVPSESVQAHFLKHPPRIKYRATSYDNTDPSNDDEDFIGDGHLVATSMLVKMIIYSLNNVIEAIRLSNRNNRSITIVKQEALQYRENIMLRVHETFDPVCMHINYVSLSHCLSQYNNMVHSIENIHSRPVLRPADYDSQLRLVAMINTTVQWLLLTNTRHALKEIDAHCTKEYWEPSTHLIEMDKHYNSDVNATFLYTNNDNNGEYNITVPSIGMGLGCPAFGENKHYHPNYVENSPNLINVLQRAIQLGVRFFDTSELYNNEELLGEAIASSLVSRDKFVISTKLDDANIPSDNAGVEVIIQHIRDTVKKSLRKLRTSYIDFIHIHHYTHYDSEYIGTSLRLKVAIATLFELKNEGLLRCVLHNDWKHAIPKKQMFHWYTFHSILQPARPQSDIFFKKIHGIHSIGVGQLIGLPDTLNMVGSSHIKAIANFYRVSGGQVLLRWSLQTGFGVLPCSAKEHYLKENSPKELLGFKLNYATQQRLNEMHNLLKPLNELTSQLMYPVNEL